ncbi:MAG TPA: alpha-galactosidase [Anaerolineales bacterium]|nr:alpha-galactosidase [Anaerolineales bacterium]
MTITLTNRALVFRLDERSTSWSLEAEVGGRALKLSAMTSLRCRVGGRSSPARPQRIDVVSIGRSNHDTPLGRAHGLTTTFRAPDSSLTGSIEWAVSSSPAALLWRIRLEGGEACNSHLAAVDLLHGPVGRTALAEIEGLDEPAAFVTGWQSFGFAGSLGRHDRYPRTRLGPILKPSREPPGRRVPRGAGRMSSEMWAVVGSRTRRVGWLVGVLSELAAFSSLDIELYRDAAGLHLWSDGDDIPLTAGRSFVTDWAYLQPVAIDDPDPLGPYLEAAARVGFGNRTPPTHDSISGWCSWYRWFSHVDEEAARENLAWLAGRRDELPLDVFLLDDGYERAIGDWAPPWPKFPHGPADLAGRAGHEGVRPGLWMAPFVAAPSSDLAREHPAWILRDDRGKPVPIGLVGNLFPWAIDGSNPEALDHLASLMETAVQTWGFQVLKLDFLYAGALRGRRHDGRWTRAQAFRFALERMRSAAGKAWIIGCGCPLGPAIGLVDSLRVSPDVAPHWHPHFRGIDLVMHHEATVPAARNSIRNSINLAPLNHRWWVNDPDCVLLQPHPSGWADAAPSPRSAASYPAQPWARWMPPRGLKEHELQTVLTLAFLTGGSIVASDHWPEVDARRLSWLGRALPPLVARARAVDWFDRSYPSTLVVELDGATGRWWLVALVNWSERATTLEAGRRQLALPEGRLHAIDVWAGRLFAVDGETIVTPTVPPHGVVLTSLRMPVHAGGWLGDTFDLSGGRAVRRQERSAGAMRFQLELPRTATGEAWVTAPAPPVRILADARPLTWSIASEGVYTFSHSWTRSTQIVVEWSPKVETTPSSHPGGR